MEFMICRPLPRAPVKPLLYVFKRVRSDIAQTKTKLCRFAQPPVRIQQFSGAHRRLSERRTRSRMRFLSALSPINPFHGLCRHLPVETLG